MPVFEPKNKQLNKNLRIAIDHAKCQNRVKILAAKLQISNGFFSLPLKNYGKRTK
jgi:hypothetical protein